MPEYICQNCKKDFKGRKSNYLYHVNSKVCMKHIVTLTQPIEEIKEPINLTTNEVKRIEELERENEELRIQLRDIQLRPSEEKLLKEQINDLRKELEQQKEDNENGIKEQEEKYEFLEEQLANSEVLRRKLEVECKIEVDKMYEENDKLKKENEKLKEEKREIEDMYIRLRKQREKEKNIKMSKVDEES